MFERLGSFVTRSGSHSTFNELDLTEVQVDITVINFRFQPTHEQKKAILWRFNFQNKT